MEGFYEFLRDRNVQRQAAAKLDEAQGSSKPRDIETKRRRGEPANAASGSASLPHKRKRKVIERENSAKDKDILVGGKGSNKVSSFPHHYGRTSSKDRTWPYVAISKEDKARARHSSEQRSPIAIAHAETRRTSVSSTNDVSSSSSRRSFDCPHSASGTSLSRRPLRRRPVLRSSQTCSQQS